MNPVAVTVPPMLCRRFRTPPTASNVRLVTDELLPPPPVAHACRTTAVPAALTARHMSAVSAAGVSVSPANVVMSSLSRAMPAGIRASPIVPAFRLLALFAPMSERTWPFVRNSSAPEDALKYRLFTYDAGVSVSPMNVVVAPLPLSLASMNVVSPDTRNVTFVPAAYVGTPMAARKSAIACEPTVATFDRSARNRLASMVEIRMRRSRLDGFTCASS